MIAQSSVRTTPVELKKALLNALNFKKQAHNFRPAPKLGLTDQWGKGVQVMGRDDLAAVEVSRKLWRQGQPPPLMVRNDPIQG